ncbi:DUF3617 family protein [Altererythrobacter sp. BO-6]|uniref:DUF3617 domain-containing protein n=1 Tax=Altererythrobacter sp. BO-6 TaxID=2604537 RepID=UPI0013E1E8D5|nr:DUF3617 family protein [Altererythrobacter sp. BO-6]QIG54966.1 DUF3617 family protein [Altererythrobacter sp. BO-6]
MQLVRYSGVIAAAALLGSCAGDNPDNVPLYGDWEMITTLGSLYIDGRLVPPEMVPPELKALSASEKRCGEPMFINREWQQEDINRRVRGDCTIEQYDVTPTRVTGSGICANVAPEAGFNPRFTVDITQSAEQYRMKLEMKGDATLPGQPGRHVIRVLATQEGVRLGEC